MTGLNVYEFIRGTSDKLAIVGILFITLIAVISGCCNSEKQNNLCSMELNNLSELTQKMYESTNEDIFFNLCQLLNDSIANRTNYFYLYTATFINEITNEIKLGIIEMNAQVPPIPSGLILHLCIKDEETIFMENKQINVNDFKKKVQKFIFEPTTTKKHLLGKEYVESFGEIEVSKIGVVLSINAKENKISSNEWLLFFKCLRELVCIYEEERNNIAIKTIGKKFNSLTFEQKKAITEIIGYPIMLNFDEECLADASLQMYLCKI